MPIFIVLAQLQHCFAGGGGIYPLPVIESQKKPGLNWVKESRLKQLKRGWVKKEIVQHQSFFMTLSFENRDFLKLSGWGT